MKLAVVTASLDVEKTRQYWESWKQNAAGELNIFHVVGEMGVVPAFAKGVTMAAARGADVIACFHDDLRIDTPGWDKLVVDWFEQQQKCGLAGFFGAKSLGAGDIYQSPYSPMQLARGGCVSNMEDAELHGERVTVPTRVVCFDGFSQIGRTVFMKDAFAWLTRLGIVHHGYDSAIGAYAARQGWQAWMLPIACKHAGGQTAVGSEKYQEWARSKRPNGDQGFWEESHRILYGELRGDLPLWVS